MATAEVSPSEQTCRPIRPRELRGLWLLILTHLALSAAACVVFFWYLHKSYLLSIIHPLLAVGVPTLLLLALSATPKRLRRRAAWRWLTALTLTAWLCLLLLLYAGNWVSNRTWGSNLFFGLVVGYARHFYTYAKLSFGYPNLIFSVAGVLAVGIFVAYFKASERLLGEARAVGTWLANNRRAGLIALTLVFGFVSGVTALFWTRYREPLRQRELILSFLNTPPHFPDTPRRLAAVAADREARRRYVAPHSFQRRNVILIIVDCLRADHMSLYGYARNTTPFLDELGRSGRLYRAKLAASTCPNSACGYLSTLASKPAAELSPGNFKLFELLRDQGYSVYQILSNVHSFWYDLKHHYGDDVDFYFDGATSRHYLPTDDKLLFEGLEQVPEAGSKPAFFHFHLMSAHNYGIRREEYIRFRPAQRIARPGTRDAETVQRFINDYDNGVQQADDVIRRLFAALERKGYLQHSLVVILGDHGQAFGEHGEYGHDSSLHQAQIGIPILIYDEPGVDYPGLDFATQVDIAPTVVDRLGLPIPATWRGHSLLRREEVRLSYHEVRPGFPQGVIEARDGAVYKYIRWPRDGREELYELRSDPGEMRNFFTTAPPDLIKALREAWQKHFLSVQQGGDVETAR